MTLQFWSGIFTAIAIIVTLSAVNRSSEIQVCKSENYASAYCQCRVTMRYDDKPEGTK